MTATRSSDQIFWALVFWVWISGNMPSHSYNRHATAEVAEDNDS